MRSVLLLFAFLLTPLLVQARPAPCPMPAEAVLQEDKPCPSGSINCVNKVLREMDRRLQSLASVCDHNAVFALVYLRTTEEFKRAVQEPGFFVDNDYLIREDVVFADYYLRAYDAWKAGARDQVPEAWRIAFDAARDRAVSGSGNILLGMSAHINRDLPYVLAGLGLTFPDGSSRKPDHDKVNAFLWRVIRPALDEAARRFDPSVDDSNIDGTTLDEQAFFQLVVSWREEAWQNAVRLVNARDAAERAQVEASIEVAAAETARLLVIETSYRPPLTSSAARDAWCAAHWNEAGYGDPTPTDPVTLKTGAEAPTLAMAYPNPFNPRTVVGVSVPAEQHVYVAVYDLLGRRVALLHDGVLTAAAHRFTFEAATLPSGTYLVRVQGEGPAQVQRVTLLK